MDEHGGLVALDRVRNADGARQNELDVLKPVSRLQVRQPDGLGAGEWIQRFVAGVYLIGPQL